MSSFPTSRILAFYIICLALLFLPCNKHTLPALLRVPTPMMTSLITINSLPLSQLFSALLVVVMLMRFVSLRPLLPAINAMVVSLLVDTYVNNLIQLSRFLNPFGVNSVMTPIVLGATRNRPFANIFLTVDVFPNLAILLSRTRTSLR